MSAKIGCDTEVRKKSIGAGKFPAVEVLPVGDKAGCYGAIFSGQGESARQARISSAVTGGRRKEYPPETTILSWAKRAVGARARSTSARTKAKNRSMRFSQSDGEDCWLYAADRKSEVISRWIAAHQNTAIPMQPRITQLARSTFCAAAIGSINTPENVNPE